MSTLTAAPFNYPYDSLVQVRVIAENYFGLSIAGYNSGSARIRSSPRSSPSITISSYTD